MTYREIETLITECHDRETTEETRFQLWTALADRALTDIQFGRLGLRLEKRWVEIRKTA